MKRKAYNRMILDDGQIVEGPVVVVMDDEERPLEWHLLLQEEPATEWIGGTYAHPECTPTHIQSKTMNNIYNYSHPN